MGACHYNLSMSNERGMKKYLPFSSLIEQSDELEKMLYEKHKISKPLISNENATKIDRILRTYNPNELYRFKLYFDGYIYSYFGKIKKIDNYKKVIYFKDFYLPIKNIIDIEDNDYLFDVC